ncbi:DUF4833 domain-containing protein [Dyadobacter sp. CY356]|uniref:DUF4833 domain-containing protein n=1 Tax=Dyadobacter sp. CY356 TaxID=2906442 RepID=UPI001F4277E3|nr:DUF4833 domain-containing protein [Dyadobacter sp. CY356]MCF0055019.1 DUF4833 domain-containing protein [Dyadobacter sp. CY356]
MKYVLLIILLTGWTGAYAQKGYPVPAPDEKRLFFIQHSDNHNTFVYNANLKNGAIVAEEPVDIFKIAYADGGEKMPLTSIQKALAFGMKTTELSLNFYEMELAASKKVKFYMMLDKAGKPKVYTTVNGKKMYLERIFLKLKEGTVGMGINLEYALFIGKDFSSGQNLNEKSAEW